MKALLTCVSFYTVEYFQDVLLSREYVLMKVTSEAERRSLVMSRKPMKINKSGEYVMCVLLYFS